MSAISPFARWLIRTGSIVLIFLSATASSAQSVRWTIVNWKVRHDFPAIRRIEPKRVEEWLEDKTRAQPTLLDVRTQPEFDISHLHNAQRVSPDAPASAIHLAKNQPIVTYCSVGYRSGAFAQKLQQAGYTNVQNMSGSIFQWANEGRPVERDGQRVTKVHPYNATWGKLLNPELRAEVTPIESGM